MTLYEKQQSQGQWQNRLEQERRNISVSVEEAMIGGTDEQWSESDEEIAPGETQNGVQTSGKNLALIPPRLSLQSKILPAIRSESFVQSATAAHAAFQQSEAREKQPTKRQTSSQTNIFARLAQRLTSSLAAVSSTEQIPPSLPSASTHPLTSASQSHREQPLHLQENQIVSASPLVREVPGHVSTVSAPAKIIDAIPATPSTRPLVVQQQTGPQRLAGYTTKVHLQTAPHPQTAPLPAAQAPDTVLEGQKRDLRESVQYDEQQALREPLEIRLNIPDISKVSTRPDLVAVSLPQERVREQAVQEKLTSTHQTFFGSHAFEMGQAEVMVSQEQVQLSSVVHVTLTSNPGQTLIQYISLHPQVGFTVHLTAPASSKTTFNYALLVQSQEAQTSL